MIWHAKVGQRVRVRYNRKVAADMPHHDYVGEIQCFAKGPGPRNVQVLFDDGTCAVVPRGNLFAENGR